MLTRYTKQGYKSFYGTTTRFDTRVLGERPVQLIGLIPCRFDSFCSDCVNEYAIVIPTDKSYFYFEAPVTPTFNLYKNQQLIESDIDVNFGVKVSNGGYAMYPFYSSYTIDWSLVFAAYGNGEYHLAVEFEEDNVVKEFYSMPIRLDSKIHYTTDTVLFELTQTGTFTNWLNNDLYPRFKFSDLVVMDSIRFVGNIYRIPEETESTLIEYGNKVFRQGYHEIFELFEIKLNKISYETYSRFFLYGLNSSENNFTVTNPYKEFEFTEWNVVKEGDNSFETSNNYRKLHNVTFKLKRGNDKGFRR